MSAADSIYWIKAQRRAASMQPDVQLAVLRAFRLIRESLFESQLARIIATGNLDALLDQAFRQAVMDTAFQPVRDQIRRSVGQSVTYYAKQIAIPASLPGVTIAFDVLSPHVITGIRSLETKVIGDLQTDVRETVRAFVENGLRDGVGPRAIARDLRTVVGLGPSQLQQVDNLRDALLGQNGRSVTDYTLRDKRFDRTIAKGNLTPDKIDKMVDAYLKQRIAQNAETVSRTAVLDAQKLGQHLAVQDAISKGVYDPNRLMKTWRGVLDSRERELHLEQEGSTVAWDQPYPGTGEIIPGSSTYNCRCVSIYRQRPVQRAA